MAIKKNLFVDLKAGAVLPPVEVSDADLKLINGLNKNGPITQLKKDDIITRSILILGEEPTSKLSIHPNGELNGKNVKSLDKIVKLLPGAPMMEGHRRDKVPWGRVYKAEVVNGLPGYKGGVVKAYYYFVKDEDGVARQKKIDAGILAEGSISYSFEEARCSICHKPMSMWAFFTMGRCKHKLGKKDDATGQICYWYPHNLKMVGEISHVYRGAYRKTKSMLSIGFEAAAEACYSADEIEGAKKLQEDLNHFIEEDENADNSGTIDGQSHEENTDGDRVSGSSNSSPEKSEQGESSGGTGTDSNNGNAGQGSDESSNPAGDGEAGENSESSGEETGTEKPETEESSQADKRDGEKNGGSGNKTEEAVRSSEGEKSESERAAADEETEETGSAGTTESARSDSESGHQGSGAGDDGSDSVTEKTKSDDSKSDNTGDKEPNTPETENSESPEGHNISADSIENNTSGQGEQGDEELSEATPIKLDENEQQQVIDFKQNSAHGLSADEIEDSLMEIVGGSEGKLLSARAVMGSLSESEGQATRTEASPSTQEEYVSCGTCNYSSSRSESTPAEGAMECPRCGGELALASEEPTTITLNASCDEFCGYERHVHAGYDATVCPDCGSGLAITELAQLFKPVKPVKPAKAGAVNNEFFEKSEFKKLPEGRYYVEPKYDGVWMQAHKDGDRIELYSDEGNKHTKKFPGIVAELAKMKTNNFIILGEVVKYRGRQRLTHTDVTAWIQSKQESYDDKAFRFKPFTVIYLMGENVGQQSFVNRRKMLQKHVPWGKQVHITQGKWVSHKAGAGRIISVIDDRKTREGAMVTNADATYDRAGSKSTYKWKRQFHVDCIVQSVAEKSGGGWVYTCAVGNKDDRKTIGKTYATKIKAAVGDIITVAVDKVVYNKEKDQYSWHVPKVTARRDGKSSPDPLSTLKRIAVQKSMDTDPAGDLASLGEVVPCLMRVERTYQMWLAGSIVEHGITSNDIDLVTDRELDDAEKAAVREALGEKLAGMIDFVVDKGGPAGPNLPITATMTEDSLAQTWKHARRFVLQEHGWGKKSHFDLRFGAPKTPRMWGFTLFSKPTAEAGGRKVRGQEKKYHEVKWMDIDKRGIKPGEDGHPGTGTFKGNAYMVIVDSGKYDYIKRKKGFLEVVLHGKKYKGRYVFREIVVAPKKANELAIKGDEAPAKSEKIWVVWKTKDQTPSAPVKKLNMSYVDGSMVIYESDEDDTELMNLPELEQE